MCLCGCAVNKITTADPPQISDNGTITDNNNENPTENISYTVIYVDGDTELDKATISAGAAASNKTAPEKDGYNFVGWTVDGKPFDFATPINADLTLTAKYTPIIYTAVYKVNGNIVNSVSYSVENKELATPAVPERYGYHGEWEKVELCGDVIINAVYIPTVYKAKFVINGTIADVVDFTIEDKSLTEPVIPSIPHYTSAWESYEISARDITINAVYTPITYYLTFVSGSLQTTVPYTILSSEIAEPEPAQKDGYTVNWEPYNLDFTNATINAVYTLIDYTLIFIANGQVVDTTIFNVENITDISVPQVPQRLGFECKWQNFEINLEDTVVYAEYTMTFKDEFTYSLSKDKTYYTVTGYSGRENYLVIPSEHNGLPVKDIGEYAFIACTNFTSVDICNGIEIIDEGAFMACSNLNTVLLPESLTTIDVDAFADCGILQIVIPENVTKIGNNAFCGCNSLTNLTINGSTKIGEYAFSMCQSLKYLDFGNKVEIIGAKAFYNCNSIEEIYIPASVKEIGANAFYGCSCLRLVEFENCSGWSVTSDESKTTIFENQLADGYNATILLTVEHVTNRWECN
ncbi:MAG: leucine-rich repeat protein [Clostridia bacterium]|nr:leucine-rich repeat protein [Clostridia bacterium]